MFIYEKNNLSNNKFRLFCFPYAGGGASFFDTFSSYLSDKVDLLPINLPGRDQRLREQPFTRVEPLVESLIHEIQFYLDTPFAFWGHCVGAIIAFELAIAIQQRLNTPCLSFFASGCPAPQVVKVTSPYYDKHDDDFITEIRKLNQDSNNNLPNDETLKILLPGLRADFELYETYKLTHNEKLACPIIALGSKDDTRVDEIAIKSWQECSTKFFAYHSFTGNHFFVNQFPKEISKIIWQNIS